MHIAQQLSDQMCLKDASLPIIVAISGKSLCFPLSPQISMITAYIHSYHSFIYNDDIKRLDLCSDA